MDMDGHENAHENLIFAGKWTFGTTDICLIKFAKNH